GERLVDRRRRLVRGARLDLLRKAGAQLRLLEDQLGVGFGPEGLLLGQGLTAVRHPGACTQRPRFNRPLRRSLAVEDESWSWRESNSRLPVEYRTRYDHSRACGVNGYRTAGSADLRLRLVFPSGQWSFPPPAVSPCR